MICYASKEKLKTPYTIPHPPIVLAYTLPYPIPPPPTLHYPPLPCIQEHYIFCHDALADFVETLSEASGYSNF